MKLPEKAVCKKHTHTKEKKKKKTWMFHIPKALLYAWKLLEN